MSKVTNLFNSVKDTVGKHSPEILVGLGIAGMVTTTVLAVGATPKALRIIEMERERRSELEEKTYVPEINNLDVVKLTWKCYIPAALSGAFSVACIIGASSVNAKRNAALATAYKLSEEALTIYKEKVIETIGEKKEKVIQDKVAQERVDKKPVNAKEVIITGNGTTLCFDSISSRYFESDMETIRRAVNNLNAQLISQDYISLNEFYDELELDHTRIGDDIGWNISKDGLVDISFSSSITKDGRPCLVLDYRVEPRYDFSKLL